MNPVVATSSALGAAALFALATAIQAKALRDAVPVSSTSGEVRTVVRAFRSPVWLGGSAIAGLAFGLHALALHEGSLSFVQPLLVTMVVFALPVSRALGGPRPRRSELLWAFLLIIGLVAFFVAADPVARRGSDLDKGAAAIASVLALVTIVGCVVLARMREGVQGAALLGGAAGVSFAGVAALVKTSTNTLTHGVVALLLSWNLYALLGVGAAGIVLSQLAYRAGPLSASLPALNSVNPLASVLIGVGVFDEHFRTGALASTVEAIGLSAVTVAVVTLSRPAPAGVVATPAVPRTGPPGLPTPRCRRSESP
jgi:drug/metabolite transporter (DMT)-like permease